MLPFILTLERKFLPKLNSKYLFLTYVHKLSFKFHFLKKLTLKKVMFVTKNIFKKMKYSLLKLKS